MLAALIMLFLDFLWLSITKNNYSNLVSNVQNSSMHIKIVPAIVAYLIMVLSLYFIVFPLAQTKKGSLVWRAASSGGLFGFIVYGIFNATNMAIFKNYKFSMAIVDTLWGVFLFFIVTFFFLASKLHKKFFSI